MSQHHGKQVDVESQNCDFKKWLNLLPCPVEIVQDINSAKADSIIMVHAKDCSRVCSQLGTVFTQQESIDASFHQELTVLRCPDLNMPVIYSPLGYLNDYNDVRVYRTAIGKGINRAIAAGSKYPVLVVPNSAIYENTELCSIQGALYALHVPFQLREEVPERRYRVKCITFLIDDYPIFTNAIYIETGLTVARDISGSDPETMAPPRVEEYIRSIFNKLKVTVISDEQTLKREYPLFAAVDRGARAVKRHQGRIIFIEYKAPKPKKSLLLVGKGVTFDTGGLDVKIRGQMVGMSRDKSGAGSVAGIMQYIQIQKPKYTNVIAALCMVRNSIGSDAYVDDEVITARSGVRVRVSNTDAEGRFAMCDALCKMKELARDLPDPHIFTVATLTGNALATVGTGYSIIVENSVAYKTNHGLQLKQVGDKFADPLEYFCVREEDFIANKGQGLNEDLIQLNIKNTSRGFLHAAAFLLTGSGLDKHDSCSELPIKFTHIDIAPALGLVADHPAVPYGSPLVAFIKLHIDPLRKNKKL